MRSSLSTLVTLIFLSTAVGCGDDSPTAPRDPGTVTNGDFEGGSISAWKTLGLSAAYNGTRTYAELLALGSPTSFEPGYEGGEYAAFARTGSGIEAGFYQTIPVTPGESLYVRADFLVREVQIPDQERAEQWVRLYLDGQLVDEQHVPSTLAASGTLSGRFTPTGRQMKFTMVSYRPLNEGTGNGFVAFDNAWVSGDFVE